MTGQLDPFEVLGIPPTASPDDVFEAWERAAAGCASTRFTQASSEVQKDAARRRAKVNWAYAQAMGTTPYARLPRSVPSDPSRPIEKSTPDRPIASPRSPRSPSVRDNYHAAESIVPKAVSIAAAHFEQIQRAYAQRCRAVRAPMSAVAVPKFYRCPASPPSRATRRAFRRACR